MLVGTYIYLLDILVCVCTDIDSGCSTVELPPPSPILSKNYLNDLLFYKLLYLIFNTTWANMYDKLHNIYKLCILPPSRHSSGHACIP